MLRKDKDPDPVRPGDWMDELQGDSETQRVLRMWKGKRFLQRLRRWCDADRDGASEGTGRTSWPRK
jgi:hypothetical protein